MKYWYDTEFYEDGKQIHFISIGIVAEDGRELYMESDFCWESVPAGHWLWENVYPHLNASGEVTDKQNIAEQVRRFITKDGTEFDNELWGYYSAYDHVVLAQLFGRMVDMPHGIPWFTQDIRQLKEMLWRNEDLHYEFPEQEEQEQEHHALNDAWWNKMAYDDIMRFAQGG